ncbi:MAG: hypothetical protein JSS20_17520 [Proteobacteria bacterium]|nr:hypothetical protein [Pseudomonadota bacterium]
MRSDDEEEERRRQARERARLEPEDRLYGDVRRTKSGRPDARSKEKRRYRVVQMQLRLRLRVRAMIDRIMERDRHPSRVVLFEEMLQAYLEKFGPLDQSELPSDDELVEAFLEEQDNDDAE